MTLEKSNVFQGCWGVLNQTSATHANVDIKEKLLGFSIARILLYSHKPSQRNRDALNSPLPLFLAQNKTKQKLIASHPKSNPIQSNPFPEKEKKTNCIRDHRKLFLNRYLSVLN